MGIESFLYVTGSQAWIILRPRQHLAILEVSLIVTTGGGGVRATRIWCKRPKRLLNSLQPIEWLLPHNKELSGPKCQ